LWDARRLAKARADAKLDIVIVEARERPRTIVGQDPLPGLPLPANKTIRVEVSTPSWLRNLPGIYQDTDEEHADFMKRFLSLQQHVALQIDEKLESIHSYFDPRETPEGFLPWLAGWLAMGLHEGWSEKRRREIILRAVEIYLMRGTAKGLKLALELFAETLAEIEEFTWPYPGFVVGHNAVIDIQSTIARPVFQTQCFVVHLPVAKDRISREKLRTVHAVVEAEKPAHAYYALKFLPSEEKFEAVPFWRMRVTGRMRVDARIAGRTDLPELDEELMTEMNRSKTEVEETAPVV
jgi:phage tail-like protein